MSHARRLARSCSPCLVLALACQSSPAPTPPISQDKGPPSAPAQPAARPEPPAATALAPTRAVVIDPRTLPTEEDFEEEAAKQITPANLEKQLEAIEKEAKSD